MTSSPVVLCILDGMGWGRRDDGDAVSMARTPYLDRLMVEVPWCLLQAHGTAVGMPSDGDMGNSEVGHNAMGAGRVFDQGAKLVDMAIESGRIWRSDAWRTAVQGRTLHLLGLVSDGNVHSHIDHLRALIDQAVVDGVQRLRLHALTDGRDVSARSALCWIPDLEQHLRQTGRDFRIATGGGRMHITMDRYGADWSMVERGWRCHVHAEGRRFPSASDAISTLYEEDPEVNDQWLSTFVVEGYEGMEDGDTVVFFNFRGDRAIEISRAFEEGGAFDEACFDRGQRPSVRYFGMMEYDGDLHVPSRYLVEPPQIERTVGQYLAEAGLVALAIAETQKYGHVTYFFNGNNSQAMPGEQHCEIPSDVIPFQEAPAMKAREVTDEVCRALGTGRFGHVRLNLANGDMVGHTGVLDATLEAVEVVDECVARLDAAVALAGGVMLITADHGNADEMFQVESKTGAYKTGPDGARLPSTSHSRNPVPLILADHSGRWALTEPAGSERVVGGIARIGATVLQLCGVMPPSDYLPSLVEEKTP